LYGFCEELVAIDLQHMLVKIIMPRTSEASMEQLAPSEYLLFVNNRSKLLVLADV